MGSLHFEHHFTTGDDWHDLLAKVGEIVTELEGRGVGQVMGIDLSYAMDYSGTVRYRLESDAEAQAQAR